METMLRGDLNQIMDNQSDLDEIEALNDLDEQLKQLLALNEGEPEECPTYGRFKLFSLYEDTQAYTVSDHTTIIRNTVSDDAGMD